MRIRDIDLTALNDIADHPRVQTARRELTAAEKEQNDTETRCVTAEAELRAAEEAAASGNRDERRLRTAREQAMHWQGEMRIVAHRVVLCRQRAEEAYRAACVEVHAALVEAHREAIRHMDAALLEARRHSYQATSLEEVSSRLFAGGMYRRFPGRALPPISWQREFGGPNGNEMDTRYALWRKHCGVFKS